MRKSILLLLVSILIVPLTALAGSFPPPSTSNPHQETENLTLAGLESEVRVLYDEWGVPHIYATTLHDLLMAQGYVHAQDRWWQMEWNRHLVAGRLAELAGETFLDSDIQMRTLGLPTHAQNDLDHMDATLLAYLQAFTDGINAYLEGKTPEELAIEYTYLWTVGNQITAVAPWQLIDTQGWLQAMNADLALGGLSDELTRFGVRQQAGPLGVALFLPDYNYAGMPIITEPGWQPSDATQFNPSAAVLPEVASIPSVGFERIMGIGSNSWVVSGDHTESGMPLLANDMHLGIQLPAIWYEIGLHCIEINEACPVNLQGITFPNVPGVVAGHNDHIAWGFTNLGTDIADVFLMELNPDNPNQYLYNGEYVDMDVTVEQFDVFRGDTVEVEVKHTVFGPMIHELVGFDDDPMAFKYGAADASRTFEAITLMNMATNWDEFQAAVTKFDTPAQNIVYADVEGNIGYISAGRIPIRVEGHNGREPVSGIDDTYQWQGYVDPMDNPRLFNPDSGYVVTANNAAINPDNFPHMIALDWDFGYRAARLETLVQAFDTHSVETMAQMQYDSYNPAASFMIPALQAIDFENDDLDAAVDWLADWDYQNYQDSSQAVLFNAFWKELMPIVFDELGGDSGNSNGVTLMSGILGSAGVIWQNRELGLRDPHEIMTLAFESAYTFVTENYGDDLTALRWGDVHRAVFENDPLVALTEVEGMFDEATAAEIVSLFEHKISVSGSGTSPNATGWSARASHFEARGGIPSHRNIFDLSDWDNFHNIIPTGQSGDPNNAHYTDQMPLWANGEYKISPFSVEAVAAAAVRVLILQPE